MTVRWHFCVSGLFFVQAKLWIVPSSSYCFSVELGFDLQALLPQTGQTPACKPTQQGKEQSQGAKPLPSNCRSAEVPCLHNCPSWTSEKSLALFLRDGEIQSPCTCVNTPQTAGSTSNPVSAGRKSFSTNKLHPCSSQPCPDSSLALSICQLMLLQTHHGLTATGSCLSFKRSLPSRQQGPLEDRSAHCPQGSPLHQPTVVLTLCLHPP